MCIRDRSQLMSVTTTLQHFQETLDSTVVYPLPKFPTTSHENLLTTLLRKKNAPEVDDWISDARETLGIDLSTIDPKQLEKTLQNDKDITKWALGIFTTEFEKHNFKDLENEDELNLSSKNNYKPSKPFSVESILNFTYRGELALSSTQEEV